MILALILLTTMQGAPAAAPGTISGQLQTPDGHPAAGVRVSALAAPSASIRPSDGQNYFATVVPSATAITNAEGRYQLSNLPTGRFLVLASALGYPTYYPSTAVPDEAVAVDVGLGASVERINFVVHVPPGARVAGRITPPPTGARELAVLSGIRLAEMIETRVEPDGSFTFGHLPSGAYLVNIFPSPPGMPAHVFQVDQSPVTLALDRPAARAVTGRIEVPRGPLPHASVAFVTDWTYIAAPIDANGTFRAHLQPGQHRIDVSGLPHGYSAASVRVDSKDVSDALDVRDHDIATLVITLAPPDRLPRIRGSIVGLASGAGTATQVELSGGRLTAPLASAIAPDGTFEFTAMMPGTYRMRVSQRPDIPESFVVVSADDVEVRLAPARE